MGIPYSIIFAWATETFIMKCVPVSDQKGNPHKNNRQKYKEAK